jgi:hypothetical protein
MTICENVCGTLALTSKSTSLQMWSTRAQHKYKSAKKYDTPLEIKNIIQNSEPFGSFLNLSSEIILLFCSLAVMQERDVLMARNFLFSRTVSKMAILMAG